MINGKTTLIYAVMEGNPQRVESCIQDGVNIDFQDDLGMTALMYTPKYVKTLESTEKIVKILLRAGANLDLQDNTGFTALIYSINYYSFMYYSAEIVKILVDKGANVNLPTQSGTSALMFASRVASLDILNILINAGANIEYQNKYANTSFKWTLTSNPVLSDDNDIKCERYLTFKFPTLLLENKNTVPILTLVVERDKRTTVKLIIETLVQYFEYSDCTPILS